MTKEIHEEMNFTCKLCGSTEQNMVVKTCHEFKIMKQEGYCFNCAFWYCWAQRADSPRSVRVNGHHYRIQDDTPRKGLGTGHGGSAFYIKFHDGRKIVTHNLWHQGEIPGHFKEELPDNAVFLRNAQYKALPEDHDYKHI